MRNDDVQMVSDKTLNVKDIHYALSHNRLARRQVVEKKGRSYLPFPYIIIARFSTNV